MLQIDLRAPADSPSFASLLKSSLHSFSNFSRRVFLLVLLPPTRAGWLNRSFETPFRSELVARQHHCGHFQERARRAELCDPDARPGGIRRRAQPSRLHLRELSQLALQIAHVITVQAHHMVHRRSGPTDNGFKRGEHVLRLTAEIDRKPSLGVDPNDAGHEDMIADPNGWRKLEVVGNRFHKKRYDSSEPLWHSFSSGKGETLFGRRDGEGLLRLTHGGMVGCKHLGTRIRTSRAL